MLRYNEVFRDIEEYPGYLVSNYGAVVNCETDEVVKPYIHNGYVYVYIRSNGVGINQRVHRLVLMGFEPLDNCEVMVVNHLDGNTRNNYVYNLEWSTDEDNRIHAGYFGLAKAYIPVYIRFDGSERDIFFLSYQAASEYIGVSKDKIAYAIRFPNNQMHDPGFRIRHKDDEWLPLNKWARDKNTWTKTIQSNAVTVRNLQSGEVFELPSQNETCQLIGVCAAVVSTELSSGNQRILPGWWQIKPLKNEWVFVKDIWLKYEQDNDNIRVIKMTDSDDQVTLFTSAIECAKYIGVSKTNLNYNLTKKNGQRNKHGYIFEYYSDGVR